MCSSARKIQATWRRYLETRDERAVFIDSIAQIEDIQSTARGFMVRQRTNKVYHATVRLQEWLRHILSARRQRQYYLNLRAAIIFVQQRRRETMIARINRYDFLSLKSAVMNIQTAYLVRSQTKRAVLVLQRAWRHHAWLVRMRRMMAQAVIIQSVWRGYHTRQTANPRLRIIRKRLTRIHEKGIAHEDTLAAKTMKAMEMMQARAGFSRGIQQLGKYPVFVQIYHTNCVQ